MAYTDHYKLADDMIDHLDTVIVEISDPFIASRYVGFVAITGVTVYELAIKEIFIEFGEKKHRVLGSFTRSYFDRINGRIKLRNLRKEYINRFGEKYVKRFDRKLNAAEKQSLQDNRVSIINSYTNIITWRHQFSHEGTIPATANYQEITNSYKVGKEVIRCLAESMRR